MLNIINFSPRSIWASWIKFYRTVELYSFSFIYVLRLKRFPFFVKMEAQSTTSYNGSWALFRNTSRDPCVLKASPSSLKEIITIQILCCNVGWTQLKISSFRHHYCHQQTLRAFSAQRSSSLIAPPPFNSHIPHGCKLSEKNSYFNFEGIKIFQTLLAQWQSLMACRTSSLSCWHCA